MSTVLIDHGGGGYGATPTPTGSPTQHRGQEGYGATPTAAPSPHRGHGGYGTPSPTGTPGHPTRHTPGVHHPTGGPQLPLTSSPPLPVTAFLIGVALLAAGTVVLVLFRVRRRPASHRR